MKEDRHYAHLADTALPGLRILRFLQQTISTYSVRRLFTSSTLAELKGLDLYACSLEHAGAVALFEEATMPNLEYLDIGLQHTSYNDALLQALGRSSALANLEMLCLGHLPDYLKLRSVTEEGLVTFAETCQLPRLRRITIQGGRALQSETVVAALEKRFEVSF